MVAMSNLKNKVLTAMGIINTHLVSDDYSCRYSFMCYYWAYVWY